MFERHVSIIGASWRITLIDGAHIVNYIHHIRGEVPPQITSHLFPHLWDFNWERLITICSSSSDLHVLGQGPRPNILFWAIAPTLYIEVPETNEKIFWKKKNRLKPDKKCPVVLLAKNFDRNTILAFLLENL